MLFTEMVASYVDQMNIEGREITKTIMSAAEKKGQEYFRGFKI